MPFTRPSATKAFSADSLQKINEQLKKQEAVRSTPRTTDPNFPVFRVPRGEGILVYIPNHTMVDDEGNITLRWDTPLFHSIKTDERSYSKVRCVAGIVSEDLGLDGTCPIDEGISLSWDLANANIDIELARNGLDGSDRDNESVKSIRSKHFRNRVITAPDRSFTFPICVIEQRAVEGGKVATVLDEDNGKPVFNTYWYTCTESVWEKKWMAAFEALDEDERPETHAGKFFKIQFGKKDGDRIPNPMEAGRDMIVTYRPQGLRVNGKVIDTTYMDKATEDWTPDKAIEVVIDNMIYSKADLEASIAPVISDVRMTLDIVSSGGGGSKIESKPALDALIGSSPKNTEVSAKAIDVGVVDDDDSEEVEAEVVVDAE